MGNNHVLFALTKDSRILEFKIESSKIELIKELFVPTIVNFDIFDNHYFVVYLGSNTIKVYTID